MSKDPDELLAEGGVEAIRAAKVLPIAGRVGDRTKSAIKRYIDDDKWVEARQLLEVATPRPETPIRLVTTAEIFAPLPPIQWLVRGLDLCPGAPSLVAGYGYSGKTLVSQAMELAIASGIRTWGAFESKAGATIHFDYEQGEHLSRLRYQRLLAGLDLTPQDLGDRVSLVVHPEFYLDDLGVEETIAKLCEGKVLAVFDSFRAACRKTDENSSEARAPLDMLARVSERTGCTVVVIHHARKPQKDQPGGARESIRGSGALYDACSSVFVLEGQPDDPDRTLYHVKARTSGRTQDPMTLRIDDAEDGGLVVTASKAPSAEEREKVETIAKNGRLRDEVRALFQREPTQRGVDSIATKLGRKAASIRQVIRTMVDDGELCTSGSTKDRSYSYAGV